MFKILNRKLNSHNTNSCKRKYHAYLKSAEFWSIQSRQITDALLCLENNENMNDALFDTLKLYSSNNMKALKKYDSLRKLGILKSDYDNEILRDIESAQSIQIADAVMCLDNCANMKNALLNTLILCSSNNIKALKTYNLLKKLDENQEILESDYDDGILREIEFNKIFCLTTPEIYAKFDKFKIANEINE